MRPLGFDTDTIFQTDKCRALVGAWDSWRGGNLIPSRNDVELATVVPILAHIIIIEVFSTEKAIVRLIGTVAREYTGSELTGKNLIDLAPDKEKQERGEHLFSMSQQPCGGRSIVCTRLESGFEIFNEFAFLPVAPKNTNDPPQLLACYQQVADYEFDSTVATGVSTTQSLSFRYLDIGHGSPG